MNYIIFLSLFFFCFSQKPNEGTYTYATNYIFKDSLGNVIEYPLSGGYQSLNTQVLDYDGDGKHELFVLNRYFPELFVFEQLSPTSILFKKKDIVFKNSAIDRWFYIYDLDEDGDYDILTLDEYGVIGVLNNKGTNNAPVLEPYARIRDVNDKVLITDSGNLPVLFDFNKTGRKDLFITTQGEGYIIHYQNTGKGIYKKVTDTFGNVQVKGRAKVNKQTKHGQSTFAFVDFDKDNDYDILWGDQFQLNFYYLENITTSSDTEPKYGTLNENYPPDNQLKTYRNYNFPIVHDFNGDSYDDFILLPQHSAQLYNNFQLYLGTSQAHKFTHHTSTLISTVDEGQNSSINYYDINKDGKDDLFISTSQSEKNIFDFSVYLATSKTTFRYEKTYKLTHFPWHSDRLHVYDFQIVDLDKDGVWDIAYVDENGNLNVSYNKGHSEAPQFITKSIVKTKLGNQAQFRIFDHNNDGNWELISSDKKGRMFLYTSSDGALFDIERSTDLLPNIFSGRVLIGETSESTFLLNSGKSFKHLTLNSQLSPTLDSLTITLPDIRALNSLRVRSVDNETLLSFGHENGGLLFFTHTNSKKPTPVDPSVRIYPNPTSGKQIYVKHENVLDIKFYNVLGTTLDIPYTENENTIEWNFPKDLAAGVYFVKINTHTYTLIKL